eukprot:TRINITY_DN5568_c0_g1_i2.p1 TRINITY_DN5568_c0_g1~~TRINITY_DN5568_c0_g1_i2.p1  ORF type:complete len:371 (+),score=104.91 TRINITY_DN5568_c0_g1_i2:138-1250(+)
MFGFKTQKKKAKTMVLDMNEEVQGEIEERKRPEDIERPVEQTKAVKDRLSFENEESHVPLQTSGPKRLATRPKEIQHEDPNRMNIETIEGRSYGDYLRDLRNQNQRMNEATSHYMKNIRVDGEGNEHEIDFEREEPKIHLAEEILDEEVVVEGIDEALDPVELLKLERLREKKLRERGDVPNSMFGDTYLIDMAKRRVKMSITGEDHREQKDLLNRNLEENLAASDEELNAWESKLISKAISSKHLMTHLTNRSIADALPMRLEGLPQIAASAFVNFQFSDEDIERVLQNMEQAIGLREEANGRDEENLEEVNNLLRESKASAATFKEEIIATTQKFAKTQEATEYLSEILDMLDAVSYTHLTLPTIYSV